MVKDIINDEIDAIIDDILSELVNYDGSVESAINIIEYNQLKIDKLKGILTEEDISLDLEYYDRMETIVNEQNKLFKELVDEKADILKRMKQIHKKNKVVNNYISRRIQTIFVDKNT